MKSDTVKSKKAVEGTAPTKCKFFLADDVRIEQGGKPTAVGLYPEDKVVVLMPKQVADPTPDKPIGIPSLAILAAFYGAKGTYSMNLELFGPSNRSMGSSKIELKGEGGIHYISRFMPMPIIGFGSYKLALTIAKKSFTYKFLVVRGEQIREDVRMLNAPQLKNQKAGRTKKHQLLSGASKGGA